MFYNMFDFLALLRSTNAATTNDFNQIVNKPDRKINPNVQKQNGFRKK